MAKKARTSIDSVGWLFWFVVFLVLLGPSIYLSFQWVTEDEAAPIPVGMGVLLAGFVAAIVAWIVNSILQARARRQQSEARKKAKRK
jgi:uncharacterized membrane protein